MKEITRTQTIHTLVEWEYNGVIYQTNISHFQPKDEEEITANIERRIVQEKSNIDNQEGGN
jgi:hypothetical protein